MIKKYIKRNTLLYKLFLYYRLIYKEKFFFKRKTYSQSGEDIFIEAYMKRHNIKNGKYVDVGAFHPIKYSNTCLLFNKGWSGINIDLNPTSIDYFKILRPKDKNVCCAISNKEKKTRIFINNIFSPLNTISRKHASRFNFDSKNELQFFTKSRKFNNIVKKKFNFLNIDIEGLDYQVLKSINFNKYRPNLICIEILDKKKLKDIKRYLNKFEYYYIKRFAASYLFEYKR